MSQLRYKTVFLGGLPECEKQEIVNLLGGAGTVVSTRLRDGYAFIDFLDKKDAQSCIERLDKSTFKGKEIKAEFSRRQSKTLQVNKCRRCGFSGHSESECAREAGTCFECGSSDHEQRNCPHRFIPRNVKSNTTSKYSRSEHDVGDSASCKERQYNITMPKDLRRESSDSDYESRESQPSLLESEADQRHIFKLHDDYKSYDHDEVQLRSGRTSRHRSYRHERPDIDTDHRSSCSLRSWSPPPHREFHLRNDQRSSDYGFSASRSHRRRHSSRSCSPTSPSRKSRSRSVYYSPYYFEARVPFPGSSIAEK